MATITFNGTSYTVDHAVKGPDYVHGYAADGTPVFCIEGITDFSVVTYDGTYMSPDDCATEGCNNVMQVAGKLQTADGDPVTAAVGNANKLGGKGASEYVDKFAIGNVQAEYRIFARFNHTMNNEPETMLISGGGDFSNIDGLWAVSFVSRQGYTLFTVRELLQHSGNITFGYYTEGSYTYFGAYVNRQYSSKFFINKLDGNSALYSIYGAEYGEFYTGTTKPNGWTTVTTHKFTIDTDLANYQPRLETDALANVILDHRNAYRHVQTVLYENGSYYVYDATGQRYILNSDLNGATTFYGDVTGCANGYSMGVRSHSHDSVDCTNMTIPQLKEVLTTWADSGAVNVSDFNAYTVRVGKGFVDLWNSGNTTSVCGWGGWWYWYKLGADTTSGANTRFLVVGYDSSEIYYVTNNRGVWSNLTPLLHSGNIDKYALSINGGTVNNATSTPMSVKSNSGDNCYVGFYGPSNHLGALGFAGVDNPVLLNGAGNSLFSLLHTGNSAKLIVSGTPLTEDGAVRVW